MSERIVVVDDEPGVRGFVSAILRRRGFDVIEADGASDALLAVQQSDVPVDLVVTDVHMPSMNGYELAMILNREHPDCRILLMSGLAAEDPARPYPLLRKPFVPSALLERVTQIVQQD